MSGAPLRGPVLSLTAASALPGAGAPPWALSAGVLVPLVATGVTPPRLLLGLLLPAASRRPPALVLLVGGVRLLGGILVFPVAAFAFGLAWSTAFAAVAAPPCGGALVVVLLGVGVGVGRRQLRWSPGGRGVGDDDLLPRRHVVHDTLDRLAEGGAVPQRHGDGPRRLVPEGLDRRNHVGVRPGLGDEPVGVLDHVGLFAYAQ